MTDTTGQPTSPTQGVTHPVVLFSCIHNSGRSVAAARLTQHYGGDRVTVSSAGSEPGDGVNPTVAQVLTERGIRIDDHRPSLLTYERVADADIVITMGCGEACPAVPGKRIVDWDLEDPKGKDRDTVRRIIDDIDERVRSLLLELGVPLSG
jgi:arsenate reductase